MKTEHHICLRSRFTEGDFTNWLEWFEICAAANKWDKDTMALKLPTLLKKEALVLWLEIPSQTRNDYDMVKKLLKNALKLNEFSSCC